MQYNELAKLCGRGAATTPPLSLASSPKSQKRDAARTPALRDILDQRPDIVAPDAAWKVKVAVNALQVLQNRNWTVGSTAEGVKIWAGPSADKIEPAGSMMPSIHESPLEQDFTIEGKPSKLGCPFASMAKKKLSSHAASVLSRYNSRDSATGVPSTPVSSVSRVNGTESFARRGSGRKASFADPIKAEICGLSDHQDDDEDVPAPERVAAQHEPEKQDGTEAGVCPIRFLDQHSPEEVATYFEKHKHELPRSHEVCVRRYQSNEDQIRELDAKYGNLVSMIQGLGARHKDMLPEEPAEATADVENALEDAKSTEKVRKWASSISADNGGDATALEAGHEDRQSHFERHLRDIRVGESPSRPWGISVPARYLEEARSETSSKPAQVASSPPPVHEQQKQEPKQHSTKETTSQAARCPFGFDQTQAKSKPAQQPTAADPPQPGPAKEARAVHIEPEPADLPSKPTEKRQPAQMVFTGPVFIGYNLADAARILRESGFAGT